MDPINAALAALELQDPPNYTWIAKEVNIIYSTLAALDPSYSAYPLSLLGGLAPMNNPRD